MDLKKNLNLSSASANPQKVLKIVISVSIVLLVMWLFMVSRMEFSSTAETGNPLTKQRVESIRASVEEPGTAKEIALQNEASSGIFMNAFTTFLVLITLLGGVWLWTRKKANSGPVKRNRNIGDHILGEGAQLKIIEINEEIWVLGVTSSTVNLLHTYPKSEWKEQVPQSENTPGSETFRKIFGSKL
ncbi:MAG TPA: flagellar biosynthetic protein FliO [Halalkalibaculum sp.]|nr:flagellar biosynthetic protein FliO [Halalkalibaculum sp.]